MKTAVFLQVRVGSTRLPGKALLPLENLTVIEHAMRNLKDVDADIFALLTEPESELQLSGLADKWGFQLFVGDRDDVLKRYSDAVKYFSAETVVRATGDNPLVSGALANAVIKYHHLKNADFSAFTGMPLGTGVEILKGESIILADALSVDTYEREHVSPYLYFRENEFRINRVPVSGEYYFPEGRVTLDTMEDYIFLKNIFRQLNSCEKINIQTLVTWLRMNIPANNYALAQ